MAAQTQNVRVAIDARMLGRQGTGVATYATALEAALVRAGGTPLRIADPSCGQPMHRAPLPARWLRWADALVDRPRRLHRSGDGFAARDIFRLGQVHFDRHGSLLELRAPGPAGIVHWTYPLPIRIAGWTNVYTVHDAIPLFHPALSQIDAGRHRRLLDVVAREADHMLTVSEAARQDIIAVLGCPPDAISACLPGLDIAADAPEVDTALPTGLVPGGFLLAVGSVEPRKNLLRLAEAHARSGLDLPLVIAGPDGWQSDGIAPRLADSPGIVRLPYVDRPTLVALMTAARALVFPSITEGFGLPIVEAMQLGTAVLTSRGGATEEVAGGAALLADPLSVDDIAGQIARLADDDLVARLRLAGRNRGAAFTAAAFAERVAAVHRDLHARHGGQSRAD